MGTDLVLKSQFMTFGFSKSPFFAHFQAILIFETKKVIIGFHFEMFIELFIKNIVSPRKPLLNFELNALPDFSEFL